MAAVYPMLMGCPLFARISVKRTLGLLASAACGLVSALAGIAAAPLSLPPQPTGMSAAYHSGQTFITWSERPELNGESYRVYRSASPISAGNLISASLLYSVPEGSALFFANRYRVNTNDWANRYLDRFVTSDHGPQLPAGTGLLVWTLDGSDFSAGNSGTSYYAVTTVLSGTENTQDFSAGNTTGAVSESVAEPLPVAVASGLGANGHVYVQFMNLRTWNPTFHAPRAANGFYGFSAADPGVAQAIQYAYDYALFEPTAAQCGTPLPASLPVVIWLHGWQGNDYPPPALPPAWCAYTLYPLDEGESWWFGFARHFDYRSGGQPGAGDTVVNYTEQRVLRMLRDLSRRPPGLPPDMNRVYVSGESMGGGGALALALRFPNVVAAAYASKPVTNYRTAGGWAPNIADKWGSPMLNLPVQIDAPNGWAQPLQGHNGDGVWDWQDHQANLVNRPGDAMAPFGATHGLNDVVLEWGTQGAPVIEAYNASRQPWGAAVTNDGHDWGAYNGLAPTIRMDDAGVPFAGLTVVRAESVPGLSNASSNPLLPPTSTGGLNQTIRWSSSWDAWDGAPRDYPWYWQMSLCAVNAAGGACGTGISQTVDVSPRRTQSFVVVPGAAYRWQNQRVDDGTIVAQGTATADADGVLTVGRVEVTPAGNRLSIFPLVWPHAVFVPLAGR